MSENWGQRSRRQIKLIAGDPLLLIVILVILTSVILFIIYPLSKVIITSFLPDGTIEMFDHLGTSRVVIVGDGLHRAVIDQLELRPGDQPSGQFPLRDKTGELMIIRGPGIWKSSLPGYAFSLTRKGISA